MNIFGLFPLSPSSPDGVGARRERGIEEKRDLIIMHRALITRGESAEKEIARAAKKSFQNMVFLIIIEYTRPSVVPQTFADRTSTPPPDDSIWV